MTRIIPPSSRRRQRISSSLGYTLTEILIVIGLIVVLIAVAVPVLSVLSGNRSTEAAENQVGAVLGQARAQAIALQRNVGVVFYQDPASGRYSMALVDWLPYAVPGRPAQTLERLADFDFVSLPAGVGLQLVNDDIHNPASAAAARDRYVRLGAVLFDGRGQAVSLPYHIMIDSALAQVIDLKSVLVAMGLGNAPHYPRDSALPAASQLGLVIFDNGPFSEQNFDPAEGMKTTAEAEENNWLDANAVPFVINRYNGTLIRGE